MKRVDFVTLICLLLVATLGLVSPASAQMEGTAGEDAPVATAVELPEGARYASNAGVEFRGVPAVEPPITDWMTAPVTSIAREVRANAIWISIWTLPFLIIPQVLLIYVIVKFKARPGRKPATFHENVLLETIWTAVPVAALVIIAVPSYSVIRYMETPPEAELNIKIEGRQFFWIYEYMDFDIAISDQPLIVPANTTIVANVTSGDVIHAWWVPAFGVKMDTVPGRISQLWFNVEEEGWYKGQCAELCGAAHALMLIDVWVVSPEEFEEWIRAKRAEVFGEDAA